MQTPMTPVTIAKRQEIMEHIVENSLVNIAEQSVNTQEEATIPLNPEIALA